MGAFTNECLTLDGETLLAQSFEGKKIKFTRMVLGDGYQETSNIKNTSKLVSEIVSLEIHSVKRNNDNTIVIKSVFNNSIIDTGFYFREKGIFAENEEGKEVLFMYANSGNLAEYIQPGSIAIVEKTLSTLIKVTNADDIAIEYVQGVYTLIEDFEQHTSDADINITAEERDYWNESIEDTRESTVSFDEASAYAELESGDTHATLFGKIKSFLKNSIISNSITLGVRGDGDVGSRSYSGGYSSIATNNGSFAHGYENKSTGEYAASFGYKNTCAGPYSFSTGSNNQSSGLCSASFGYGNISSSNSSSAIGYCNVAKHAYSSAFGQYTKTSTTNQFVCGKHNDPKSNTVFEAGNGTSDASRSNAFYVLKDGTAVAQNDFVVGDASLKEISESYGSIIRGFGNVGSDACNAVIYSNIILKRTGTGKCDLIISGKVESITADSSCFNVFDMSKLRNLIGISNISFNPAHTTVMLEQRFLSANQANSGHYGYGQMFDGATIGRFHTTDGALGGWSASHGVYTPGTYFLINVYGATYS